MSEISDRLDKLDIALMAVPPDIAAEIAVFAGEQALNWSGFTGDRDSFYLQLGRAYQRRLTEAWDRKLNNVDSSDNA